MIVSKIKSGQTNIKHGTLSSVSVAAKTKKNKDRIKTLIRFN